MSLDLFRVAGGIQINDSTQILEGAGAPSVDAPVGSVYTNTTTGGLYTKVLTGAGTDKWELVAAKSYVDTEVAAVQAAVDRLGNAFNYIGTLAGGADAGTANDLSALPAGGKNAGDYYKVATAGYFKVGVGGTPFFANIGDGLVWNTAAGVDKIDNTNSEVQGTANFVTVTGSADTGFTVDIATAFKDRVTTAEGEIDALQTNVGALQTGLGALITRVGTAEGEIDTLQSDLTALTGRVTTARGEIDALHAADIAIDHRLDTAESDIFDLRAFVGAADGDIIPTYTSTTVVTQSATLEAAVGQLDAAVGTVQTDLNTLEAAVDLDSRVTTSTATSVADTVTAVAAKWIVHVADGANITAYELFAASNGTAVDFTRFGILRIGAAIDGLNVAVTQSGANIVLTVTATNAVTVKIKRIAVV